MAVRGLQADILENWPNGVISSIVKDRLPDGAIPFAKNSQFFNIGPNYTIFGTRHGCRLDTEAPNDSPFISQHYLNTDATDYHLLIDEEGDLKKLTEGVIESIEDTLFDNVANDFSWATAKNNAFITNGAQQFKTDGLEVWQMGIDQPLEADWSAAAQAGGTLLPADTYDVAIGYYNSTMNHTGPTSEMVTLEIAEGELIVVNLPDDTVIDDPQVDYIKIYIRQHSTMAELMLVVDGTDPAISGTNGWAVSTPFVRIDVAQASIDAFRLLAPAENENYPPPTETKYLINHRSRMFAITNTEIYWSEAGDPESFNTNDNALDVGTDDGEPITGAAVLGDALVIFKRNQIYALIGEDPRDWSIEPHDQTVGCASYKSIGLFDNKLFFMSLKGPQMWTSVNNAISDITTELIGPDFSETSIDPEDLDTAIMIGHPTQNYVAWAVVPKNDNRNSLIIPFNFKLDRWMASEWNILDVRSSTITKDDTGRDFPMIADYAGNVYKLGVADADGVPAGEDPNGAVTAASSITLTDNTKTWTVDTFIDRYVYVWETEKGVRTAQRRRIDSNTATTLTITSAWDDTPQATGWQYAIGGILLEWHSAFRNGGGPFFKKRIEFLFLELNASALGMSVDVEVYKDLKDVDPILSRTVTMGEGALWDVGIWDVDVWAQEGTIRFRIPIRNSGYNWQTRITHISNGEQLYIYRNGVQWQTKTKKTGFGVD